MNDVLGRVAQIAGEMKGIDVGAAIVIVLNVETGHLSVGTASRKMDTLDTNAMIAVLEQLAAELRRGCGY